MDNPGAKSIEWNAKQSGKYAEDATNQAMLLESADQTWIRLN